MDSANSFGSHNYVPRQYGNANQTPLFVTDRSGNLQQSSASSHNQYGHHPPQSPVSALPASYTNAGTPHGHPHVQYTPAGYSTITSASTPLTIPLAQAHQPVLGSMQHPQSQAWQLP